MFRRFRFVLAVLALLLTPAAIATTVETVTAGEGTEVATRTGPTLIRPSAVPIVPRPLAPLTSTVTMAAVASILIALLLRRSTDRPRRCLDDVGDDWRSLLLGAPPARA